MSALKIVPYDPNDYKLSEALAFSNGEKVESLDKISSVFSLYFQWPEHAQALMFVDKNKSDRLMVKMEYDKEERELTQLFVLVPLKELGTRKFFESLFLRVEVFDNCFECECTLLEAFNEEENAVFIVEIPKEINVIKNRRLPRVEIPESLRPTVTWKSTSDVGCENVELKIFSISMNSFVAMSSSEVEGVGNINFNGLEVQGKVVRKLNELVVVQLEHKDDEHVGKFFDFYRLFAYPGLVPRSEVDVNDVFNLYDKAGFFKNFKNENIDRGNINTHWKKLIPANHIKIADYVFKNNTLQGSSSLGLIFENAEKETWVFHQLCSLTGVENISTSELLYKWRAEYLWTRKNKSESIGWFRSASRWMERIYVKFDTQNRKYSDLKSCNLYTYNTKKQCGSNGEIQTVKEINFGEQKRYQIENENIKVGIGPEYVHINNNFNILWSNQIELHIDSILDSLMHNSQLENIQVRVDSPVAPINPRGELIKQEGTDRRVIIQSDGLIEFINCIKHSIEITKKKLKPL